MEDLKVCLRTPSTVELVSALEKLTLSMKSSFEHGIPKYDLNGLAVYGVTPETVSLMAMLCAEIKHRIHQNDQPYGFAKECNASAEDNLVLTHAEWSELLGKKDKVHDSFKSMGDSLLKFRNKYSGTKEVEKVNQIDKALDMLSSLSETIVESIKKHLLVTK